MVNPVKTPMTQQLNWSSILVALDASDESHVALQAAARLAQRGGMRLNTLFIEDIQWFEASRTRFVLQVNRFTGETIPTDEEKVSRQSKALSRRLEQQVSRVSHRYQVSYSYRSVRGEVNKELLQAAENVDLVAAGRKGVSFQRPEEPGSAALALAEHCSRPVLLWTGSPAWPTLLIGLSSDPGRSDTMLRWLNALAAPMQRSIRLFWITDEEPEALRSRLEKLEPALPAHELVRLSRQTPSDPEDLERLSGMGLIAIQRDDPLYRQWGPKKLLAHFRNPVLLL